MTDNNNNKAVVCIDMLDDSSSEEELELNNPTSHVSKKPAAKSKKRSDETADASALSAVKKAPNNTNSEDDSDSDLSAGPTFTTVHPPKLTKQQQREADKIAKKQQRQLAKQQQTEQKRRRVLQAQQQLGKFAPYEIVVLVHDELYQLLVGDVMDSLSPLYKIHPSLLLPATNAIQFIRQDYVLGGADVALLSYQQSEDSQETHELMNILVLLFHDASLFLELLYRDDEHDDDYPKLGEYVERFLKKDHHRITLILYKIRVEIARQWNQHKTTTTTTTSRPPPSDAEFHDSMVWLMVQYGVECIVCDSQESLVTTLSKLTRALSEQKYQQPVTELECVKKLKSDMMMTTTNNLKAQDTWIRQLQQVPGVGEQKARHLALYVPTMRSLYELYQNEPDEQKRRMLLSPLFHQGRNYPKLSETLYQLLTSENPKQLL